MKVKGLFGLIKHFDVVTENLCLVPWIDWEWDMKLHGRLIPE